jgi:hypothetical protein
VDHGVHMSSPPPEKDMQGRYNMSRMCRSPPHTWCPCGTVAPSLSKRGRCCSTCYTRMEDNTCRGAELDALWPSCRCKAARLAREARVARSPQREGGVEGAHNLGGSVACARVEQGRMREYGSGRIGREMGGGRRR